MVNLFDRPALMHKQQLFIQNSSTTLATNFYFIFLGTNKKELCCKKEQRTQPKGRRVESRTHNTKGHESTRNFI
jgi:hypothetical protein